MSVRLTDSVRRWEGKDYAAVAAPPIIEGLLLVPNSGKCSQKAGLKANPVPEDSEPKTKTTKIEETLKRLSTEKR